LRNLYNMTHDSLNKLCGGASLFLIIHENLQSTNNQERSRVLRIHTVRGVQVNSKVPFLYSGSFELCLKRKIEIFMLCA
jgi:hypothetical protein